METDCKACEKVLEVIEQYGGIDGGHHKQWVLDQILRTILGERYDDWVHHYDFDETDDDGNPAYEWDTGVPP